MFTGQDVTPLEDFMGNLNESYKEFASFVKEFMQTIKGKDKWKYVELVCLLFE